MLITVHLHSVCTISIMCTIFHYCRFFRLYLIQNTRQLVIIGLSFVVPFIKGLTVRNSNVSYKRHGNIPVKNIF